MNELHSTVETLVKITSFVSLTVSSLIPLAWLSTFVRRIKHILVNGFILKKNI